MQKQQGQVRAWLALISLMAAAPLWAADDAIVEITQGAEELKSALAAMPYASQGEGPPIYSFEFPDCPYSQRFYSDWKGELEGVQMRRFFYAVSQKSGNETAALAASRDPDFYRALMEGRQRAGRFDDPRLSQDQINQNITSFNAIMGPLNDVVMPILQRNRAIERNLVSPQLIWEENDRMYAAGGYEHAHVESILERVRLSATMADAAPVAQSPGAGPEAVPAQSPAEEGHSLDILGLTLGMTPEDVARDVATLKAELYDENRYTFSGTDIEFLSDQKWKLPDSIIAIKYARPPADPVVIEVAREFQYAGLADERLRASLQDRYGKPGWSNEARFGAVLRWYRGPNAEACLRLQRYQPGGANCSGPLLEIGIGIRDGASGRVSTVRTAHLTEYAALIHNKAEFEAHGAEIARQVEQERLKDNEAPSF